MQLCKLPFHSAALVTPAGTPKPELLERGIAFLERAGVAVKNYASGGFPDVSPQQRAEAFTRAWLDDSADVVLCARGGYGSARMMDFLDWDLLKTRPDRIVIGYSDVTALHYGMLAHKIGRPVAGIMACKLPEYSADAFAMQSYFNAVAGKPTEIPEGQFHFLRNRPQMPFTAPLIAGNLAVSVTLCGTRYFPCSDNAVLLFEDLNEPAYKLDRYFTQLRQNGFFDHCRALIFGHFSDCAPADQLRALLLDATADFSGPVITDFPFGHELPFCSLDLSRPVTISANAILSGEAQT